MDSGSPDWRVTWPDVNTTQYPEAAGYLPNPVLSLNIDDLQNATRAEAVITMWGGHVGTSNKQARFNGNGWITIPELETTPTSGQCYTSQYNVVIDVPLSDLFEGSNSFEGTCGNQTCYGFDWGQWGWYAIMVRVYYDPGSKSHATGSITSPTSGSNFSENSTVTVSTSGGADRVDVLAYYDGYDTDGDGVFLEYHHDYHIGPNETAMNIKNHVGTSTSGPTFDVNWNTDMVPEQSGIKLLARIRDGNGIWFVSDEVTNVTLTRSGSVVLYKPSNVPERYWVRDNDVYSSNVDVSTLSGATSAVLLVRTWNGINGGEGGNYTRVNGTDLSSYGNNHYYKYDAVPVPVPGPIFAGTNTIAFSSPTIHHGVEILWPGPALLIGYSSPVPIQLSSFTAVFTSQNTVRLEWTTLSETNNFGFEVQKSAEDQNNYQTIPNSFIAGHGTTIQPQSYSFVDANPSAGISYYRLKQIDLDGSVNYTDGVQVNTVTGVNNNLVPAEYVLAQNYPNPFNPSTVIRFGLPEETDVTLQVVNTLGQVVRTLVQERKPAGYHNVTLDAAGLGSGVYLYQIRTANFVQTKKLLLLR